MHDLLNTLFGLKDVGFGDEGVVFEFRRALEPWAWTIVIAGLAALAGWSYSRLAGDRRLRTVGALLRTGLLVLLLVLVTGPRLIRPNERVERDWVLAMADRSASLRIPDGPGRSTRDESLRGFIDGASEAWEAVASDKRLVWLGFDAGAYELEGEASAPELGAPDGRRTDLGRALEDALLLASARPISGVVIFSDGRSVDQPSRRVLQRLEREQIPVHVVPLGSERTGRDLAVARVDAPLGAFTDDIVPVRVEIGSTGDVDPTTARVELVDLGTDRVLDSMTLADATGTEDGHRLTLRTRPSETGSRDWAVRVVSDDDLIEENNQRRFSVDLVDRPIRAAYFDGYPRWEYRYVKNLFVREASVNASATLLARNRRYIREGDTLLETVPRSPEEWDPFDVIVIGDMRADMFSTEQLEQVREHVGMRGGGLLWIAGSGPTPLTWRDTPLEDLLPFSIEDETPEWSVPVTMSRTDAGARLGLLELDDDGGFPDRLTSHETGWSRLRWAQRLDPATLKPTTEVIANATTTDGREAPLVLTMQYGAGRIIYVGTDEIWRWRYARGEALPERFWIPLVRLLARERVGRAGRSALLRATPDTTDVGQPVRLEVTLLDQSLVDRRSEQIRLRLDADERRPIELSLKPEEGGERFSTIWIPSEPGAYDVEVLDPVLRTLVSEARVRVMLPDDELRHPEANHVALTEIATQTGGLVLDASQLRHIADHLPNREVRIVGTPDIATLWDRPIVLALLVLLLTSEWVVRKLLHLA